VWMNIGNITFTFALLVLVGCWIHITLTSFNSYDKGNTTLTGFLTAVDTLLNQAYGAKDYTIYGIWTANSLFFVSMATVLFSGYMFLCEPFMHLLALDAEIAIQSGLFARRLIRGLFPFYWFKVLTSIYRRSTCSSLLYS
jgi:Na+-driven multidrug efflux pump